MSRARIILVAALAMVAGCSRTAIRGDGVIKAEDRPVAEFSKVVVTGGYCVEWSNGAPALHISADQNLLPLITTVVSGDTLQIASTEDLAPTRSISIRLSSASLADVRLIGGVGFGARQISGGDLKLESTGAAEITVDGSVTTLEADLTGASRLNAQALQAERATVSLVGASDADVTVSDTLQASITGAGSLTYSGDPKTVEKTVLGAGTIRQRP